MNKIILLIIIGVIAGGYYFLNISGSNIADLLDHFENSGLAVRDIRMTAEEKQVFDKTKQDLENLHKLLGGSNDNNPVVESESKSINNIEVGITRYKSKSVAIENYNQRVKMAQDRTARSDYHLNGTIILEINHYDIVVVNGKIDLSPRPLNLKANDLDKIVEAFKSF